MVGTAALTFGQSAPLTGSGALASSEAMTIAASGIPGNGDPNNITGSAALLFGQNATASGSGAIATSTPLVIGGTGTLAGTNSYQPMMFPRARRQFDPPWNFYQWDSSRWTIFPYTVTTATSGIGSIAIGGDGTLRGTSAAVASAAHVLTATGTLTGSGALAGSSANTFGSNTTLTSGASGAITAFQGFVFDASGTLTGTGNLYGPADMEIGGSATYTIVNPPSGTVPMTIAARGTLINAAEGAGVITVMSFSTQDGLRMYFSA